MSAYSHPYAVIYVHVLHAENWSLWCVSCPSGMRRPHAHARGQTKWRQKPGWRGWCGVDYVYDHMECCTVATQAYCVHLYPPRHIEAIGCAHIPFGEALSVYGWANVLCTCAPEAEGGTARCLSCAQAPSAPSARGVVWDDRIAHIARNCVQHVCIEIRFKQSTSVEHWNTHTHTPLP